jgi:hypothetical protein
MANQNAIKDDNNSFSMLVADETGEETRQLRETANGGLPMDLAGALDEDIDAVAAYVKGVTATKVTSSGVVSAEPCALIGYYVGASNSGTLTLHDNASAASGETMLANGKSVAANDIVELPHPVIMQNGVYATIGGTSATVYVLTRKLTTA